VGNQFDVVELVDQSGGEFRLTAIVQKRLRELVKGARPLVDVGRGRLDLIDVTLEELSEGKIEATEEFAETPQVEIFPIDIGDE
jgi:DNA-directed RNA polymerase subunit K/omega